MQEETIEKDFNENEIGMIPENWDALKVNDCCKVVTGGTPRTEIKEYYEGGNIRWMKSGDIKGYKINEVENRITQKGFDNSNARLMPKGTVVIALSGRGKTRGTTAVLMIESTCSQSVAGMIPAPEKIESFFLHYWMSYVYNEIRNMTGDKDRSGLNLGLVRQIKIVKPNNIKEQKQIGAILCGIDNRMSIIESKKQTLQALLKTMLQKLMTGQIRVKDLDIEVENV